MEKENIITFIPRNYSVDHVYFEGEKNRHGRYTPIKKFVVDKYRAGFIEIENTHKGVEFLESEIKILDENE